MVALFLLFNYRDVSKDEIRWLGAENSFSIKNLDGLITSRDLCVPILCFYFFLYYISR
jgi:hypothetical protein